MKTTVYVAILAAIILLSIGDNSDAFYRTNNDESPYATEPTRLIVKLKGELSPAPTADDNGIVRFGFKEIDAENRKYAVRKQELLFSRTPGSQSNANLRNVYIITPEGGADLTQMKRDYEALESVLYAEPDYPVELYDTPDDPLYPHQWALHNTGQDYYFVYRPSPNCGDDYLTLENGLLDADIDAEEVFQDPPDNTSVVIVAMVDTGVDMDHPDLAPRIWVNPYEVPDNGIDDDHNGYIDDVNGWDFAGDGWFDDPDNDPTDTYGHGTHCSGIVTAVTGNATGVAGMNSDCQIMPLSFYPLMMSSWAAQAIVYAADNGADVINMSWGLPFAVKVWQDALDYARAKGVVLAAAAGNDGYERVNFPAGYDNNMAIAATSSIDEIAHFSTYGENITVCAPGYGILSLRADSTDMYGPCEEGVHVIEDVYYLASGTSMAAPHVVGAAAYLRAVSPGLTHDMTKLILEQTADDYLDPLGTGLDLPGWDKYSGSGRINLYNALAATPLVRAMITSPNHNQMISGITHINGIADGLDFTEYTVEYGEGHTPTTWTEIVTSSASVTDGNLASWNTTGLTGIFTIRLRVGEFNEDYVTVYVTNETVVDISSPSDGDTVINFTEVIGTAFCPDFDMLVLEYSTVSPPDAWVTVIESSVPVSDSRITAWETDAIPDGNYILRLSAHSSGGIEGQAEVAVYVQSLFSGENGWRVDIYGTPTIVPNYGDFDNDGSYEIVVGTSGGIKFYNPDGTLKTIGIPDSPPGNFEVPIPVGNLDGDGIDDFVAVNFDKLYGFPSSAPPFEVDIYDIPATSSYNLAEEYKFPLLFLKDIDNDGLDEIHYTSGSSMALDYYIYESDGSEWSCAFPIPLAYSSYIPADMDGDSICEIYTCDASGINQLDLCGGIVDQQAITGPGTFRPHLMSAVDLDKDGTVEVLAFGFFTVGGVDQSTYRIWAFDEGLELMPGWPHDTGIGGFYILRHPVFCDLNGDAELEYVSSFWDLYTSFVHAWSLDGSPFIGDSAQNGLFAQTPHESALHPTIVADINGDLNADILAAETPAPLSSYEKQSVAAWQYDAQLLTGWPVTVDVGITSVPARENTPVIADLNQDGFVDMLMTTINGDMVFVNLTESEHSPGTAYCPHWRYNRAMDNTFISLEAICGDANGSGAVDIDDVVYLIAYIFSSGPPPVTQIGGDPDCSGATDIDDVVYLIAYIFSGGNNPCDMDGDGVPDC